MLYKKIMGMFFDIAFDARKQMEPVPLGKGTKYEALAHENAKWLRENESKQLEVTSFDGYTLEGHYYEVPDAKRTVLCFHGWRGFWEYDFAPQARWFLENQCNVLIVEQRGQGNSKAPYMTFGFYEAKDAATWVKYMCTQVMAKSGTGCEQKSAATEMYLYGVSMGAATVMLAAGEDIVKREISGIIADCGFSDAYDMIYNFGHKAYKIPKHPIMDSFERLCDKRLGIRMKSNSPYEVMKNNHIPMLFVHGTADDFVPPEMTDADYKICPGPKKLLKVEGAEHVMSFYVNPTAYTEALKELFCSYGER